VEMWIKIHTKIDEKNIEKKCWRLKINLV